MSNLSTRTLRVTVPHAIRSKLVVGGQDARHEKIKAVLGELFRQERIEGYIRPYDETRQYAERLIELAKKYGDRHVGTMQLMDYWLTDKDLIHKVFKVFVPRYANTIGPYTNSYRLPIEYGKFQQPFKQRQNIVLEMKDNPYPRIIPDPRNYSNILSNVLLNEARKEYRNEKKKT
ncbi:unnamed protein product [Adineta ricciae]|uniref:Large ribosomal subunit protein bL17m n=1 Tax=Adineta ricciae TaxID=249248 RepID=A0A815IYW6_ADIRI|nr:unnamed protein product [Adineta ricciae]